MKRVLLILSMVLPLCLFGQNNEAKYLAGAVPVENGFVTFKKDFTATGKSKAEIFAAIRDYTLSQIVEGDNHLPQSRFTALDEEEGIIAASIEETLYFRRSALVTHSTRFFYQLVYQIADGKFSVEMRRLHYLYDEATAAGIPEQEMPAEKWIVDSEALNKSKTKLTRIAGKFRRYTIDRKDEIFLGVAKAVGADKKVEIRESY